MTNEEAIKILRSLYNVQRLDTLTQEEMTAVAMAIKALEQEPCEDCISRQRALNVVHKYFEHYLQLNDDICLDGLKSLPSVTPKEKSEYEHDHEIVKAYNDGQEFVLDRIRTEIENDWQFKQFPASPWSCGLRRAIEIIDKYKAGDDT